MDDYAKNGVPGEVCLLCSFYDESLHTWILKQFLISLLFQIIRLDIRCACSQKLFEANL